MRRKIWATALSLLLAPMALAGCSSGQDLASEPESETLAEELVSVPEVNRSPDFPLPEVKGEWGEIPTIVPIDDDPPGEIVAKLVMPGDGAEVAAGGMVTAYYTGFLWDGKTFDSSFNHGDDPSTFDLNRVVDGWKYGLAGARVGDRVLLIVPPKYGYGDAEQGSIPADSTLVFVVDVVDAPGADLSALSEATPTDEKLPNGLLVEGALGAEPVIGFDENVAAPTESVELVLAEGKGDVITAENSVIYHYKGMYWGTPTSAEGTWQTGPTVLPAEDTVFLGHHVGSRLLFVFPAESDAQPANVMVVDIAAAY